MFKKIIFIICILAVIGSSFANNFGSTDGLIIIACHSNNNDRSSSIHAYIDGHTLSVAFSDNLGNVTIEVTDDTGGIIDVELTGTPIGYQCYIPLAGHYYVYFKLDNGDEYYGEFNVTN